MIIREIRLDRFGRFYNYKIRPKEGMNIIYGGNSSGKSTIRAFILFVFFGNPSDSDGKSAEDEVARYKPRGSVSCEGSILLEYENKEYLVMRISDPQGNLFSITDMESGRNIPVIKGTICDLIPSATKDRFGNNITIPQIYDQSDEDDYKVLSRRKQALEDEIASLQKTMYSATQSDYEERVKAAALIEQNNEIAKRYQEKKQQLKEAQGKASASNLNKEIENDWDLYERRRAKLEDLKFTQSELNNEADGGSFKALAFTVPILVIAAALWLMGSTIGLDDKIRNMASCAIAVFAFLVFIIMLASSSGKKKRARKMKKKIEETSSEMRGLLKKYNVGSREELRRLSITGISNGNDKEIRLLKNELDTLKKKYNELQVPLKPYIEKYGSSITLGKKNNPELDMRVQELKRQSALLSRQMEELDVESYSADMEPAEPLPVVLDEFFITYDDNRLKRTLNWLSAQTAVSQALIITCHHREVETLTALGINYSLTELPE